MQKVTWLAPFADRDTFENSRDSVEFVEFAGESIGDGQNALVQEMIVV
jgi:hypothetical protein